MPVISRGNLLFSSSFLSPNLVGGGGAGMIICMVVVFTTTYAISAYHHLRCEFESCSGKVYSLQHNAIKFFSDLRQVGNFLRILRFPPPIKLTTTI